MSFKILQLDPDNIDISIITLIGDNGFKFFTDKFQAFVNVPKKNEEFILFQKYLNIYLFENLWTTLTDSIFVEVIEFWVSNPDLFHAIFTEHLEKFIDYKKEFWYEFYKCLLTHIDFDRNVESYIIERITPLIISNKHHIILPLNPFDDIEDDILSIIVQSQNINYDTKYKILLLLLKDKNYRTLIINWMLEVVDYSHCIKTCLIGHEETETSVEYESRVKKLNLYTKFSCECLKLFYDLWVGGIKKDGDLQKINYHYLTSRLCPLKFCETDDKNIIEDYNFLTQLYFIILKLVDNIVISSYNEISEREIIIQDHTKDIESHELNMKLLSFPGPGLQLYSTQRAIDQLKHVVDKIKDYKRIEQNRLDLIKTYITSDLFDAMTFIKYSCKWIYLQRTIIPCGNLDAILNIIMVYYQEHEEVEYHSDLFNVFKIVINCENTISDSDYRVITNNTMLKIKCMELVYTFLARPPFSDNWHIMLYFENNLDEINHKLIQLYVDSNKTLTEFDNYYKSYMKYKIVYILITINNYENMLIGCDTPIIKQFCKLILDDIIGNVELLELYLTETKKIQHNPRINLELPDVKQFLLKLKNCGVFTFNFLIIISNIIGNYKEMFVSPEIINTFTNFFHYALKTLLCNEAITIERPEDYYQRLELIKRLNRLFQDYFDNKQFIKTLMENTNGTIIHVIESLENYLLDQGLFDPIIEYNYKDFKKKLVAIQDIKEDIEPPDELCDPIMQTLIETPVMLPNSDIIMDKGVISRHLLTDKYNPFTRDELTMESLEAFNDLPDTIEQINAFKQKLDEFNT